MHIGNVLAIYILAFATIALFHGIDFWMEHPDIIHDLHRSHGAASIWDAEQTHRITEAPTAQIHRLRHSDFNGACTKPTRIVTVRMATVAMRVQQYKMLRTATDALIGQQDSGAWSTARSKEYPPLLSLAIALAMIDSMIRVPLNLNDRDITVEDFTSFSLPPSIIS